MYKLPTLQPIDAVTLLRRKCAHALLFVGCANAGTVFPGLARNYKLPGGDWGGGGLKRNPTANLPGSSSRLWAEPEPQAATILYKCFAHLWYIMTRDAYCAALRSALSSVLHFENRVSAP